MAFWNDLWGRLGLEDWVESSGVRIFGQLTAAAVFVALVGFVVRTQLVNWLQHPLYQAQLSAESAPTSNVGFQAAIFALLLAIIYLGAVYILARAANNTDRREKHAKIISWAIPGLVLVASMALTYYVLVRFIFQWLSTVDIDQIHTYITASSYRAFMTTLVALWTAQAEALVVVPLAQRLGRDCRSFIRKWRLVIEVAGCLAILVLPIAPDPISKLLLAVPFLATYEITLVLTALRTRFSENRPKARIPNPRETQRLPMAIAVPHKPRPKPPVTRVDQFRIPRQKTLDLRPDRKQFDDA